MWFRPGVQNPLHTKVSKTIVKGWVIEFIIKGVFIKKSGLKIKRVGYKHHCQLWQLTVATVVQCYMKPTQGRSQPHSPGWAIVPLSSFFLKILINFSYFFPKFYLFSSSFWSSGWASRPPGEGPGYATDYLRSLSGEI